MKSKYLSCGCCGEGFRTWPEYVDQDQDKGYGICEPCQKSISDDNEREWDKAISAVINGLNETNRAHFILQDRDSQKAFVIKALDAGAMTFTLERR